LLNGFVASSSSGDDGREGGAHGESESEADDSGSACAEVCDGEDGVNPPPLTSGLGEYGLDVSEVGEYGALESEVGLAYGACGSETEYGVGEYEVCGFETGLE
jgi:hypothetical protein